MPPMPTQNNPKTRPAHCCWPVAPIDLLVKMHKSELLPDTQRTGMDHVDTVTLVPCWPPNRGQQPLSRQFLRWLLRPVVMRSRSWQGEKFETSYRRWIFRNSEVTFVLQFLFELLWVFQCLKTQVLIALHIPFISTLKIMLSGRQRKCWCSSVSSLEEFRGSFRGRPTGWPAHLSPCVQPRERISCGECCDIVGGQGLAGSLGGHWCCCLAGTRRQLQHSCSSNWSPYSSAGRCRLASANGCGDWTQQSCTIPGSHFQRDRGW